MFWENSYNLKGFKITSFAVLEKTLTTSKDLKLLVLLSWKKNSYDLKGFKITSFAVLAKKLLQPQRI
jgi:hypothetical protein